MDKTPVNSTSTKKGPPRDSRNAQRHGLSSMKNALVRSKQVRLDLRYRTGKALVRWRLELVQDLGGEDQISTQQAALIEMAVRSKLMLDTIDNWRRYCGDCHRTDVQQRGQGVFSRCHRTNVPQSPP